MIRSDCLWDARVQSVAQFVVVVSVLSLSSVCQAQLSPARALHEAVRQAEKSEEGLAALSRMRAMRIGDESSPVSVSENSRLDFHVKTLASEPGIKPNELFIRLANGIQEHQGVKTSVERQELMAKVEERVIAGMGTSNTALKPKDLTDKWNDENWRPHLQADWKRLNANPMAMPFLTMDAFYMLACDFAAINEIHNICQLSYEDEKEMRAVWENPKVGVVIERRLSPKSDHRPQEVAFYKRAPGKDPLKKGEKLGELIYRTRTEWQKLEPTTLSNSGKETATWVPTRIEMEQFPNSYKAYESRGMIEILAVWRRVPDDFLSRKTFEAEIPIDNEWVPPNEPISILFHEMLVELEKTAAEAEQQLQRN